MRLLIIAALGAILVAAPAAAQFATGFEAPDYTAGGLTGQQSWTVSPASTNYRVTNDPVYVISGAQSYLVSANSGRAASHSIGAPMGLVTVEVKMAKAMYNTAQWWVALQNAGSADRSLAFGFNNGGIQYYSGGSWQTYQPSFNGAQVYNFKATLDYDNSSWALWVDGNLVGNNLALYSAAAARPTSIYFYRGYLDVTNLPAYANYAVADDINVVPEPASLLVLASGIAGLAARRRKV